MEEFLAMFRRILVANRGEIAARVIRACRELGVQAVAVYSEADAHVSYLKEAHQAVCIGKGPARFSYLNQDMLLDVATQTDCEAVHPGYGFLSENALFATRCDQQKLTFIGPKPLQLRLMGDKAMARETMQGAGLPVMPGSKQVLSSLDEAKERAREIGFPVLLKATAGGGGKGMRLVSSLSEMESKYIEATAEAEQGFSNPGLYLEKYIVNARHIEFQVLADTYGRVICLGERECSIQRNHQKLLEEAPAFDMTVSKRMEMIQKITWSLEQIGYQGAGTLEFLQDSTGQLYFMEMNTRIQVEHPVTELVTGVDLVAWQIRIAAGEKLMLNQSDVTLKGAAIECRLNAEDPANEFRPSPGQITTWNAPENSPSGPVRLDSHVEAGYQIPPYYDSMLGKLIVWGEDRAIAVVRLQKALAEFQIGGVKNTLELQRAIVHDPRFVQGAYHCGFLQEMKWPKST